jgi:hypothetical protein
MDKFVPLSLLALTAVVGAFLVISTVESNNKPAGENSPVLARGGQKRDAAADRDARIRMELASQGALMLTPNRAGQAEPIEPDSDEVAYDGPDEAHVDDIDAIMARDREDGERRANLVNELAAQEAEDPSWAPGMLQEIAERFAIHGPEGAQLVSSICKTSLCIVEIAPLSRSDSTGQMRWNRMLGLKRGFVINHETDVKGQYRSVVYLAREGHHLPK